MGARRVSPLGQNIFAYRTEQGLTQFELALASGVPQGMISRIESGFQADMYTRRVLALASALGTTVEMLMHDDSGAC